MDVFIAGIYGDMTQHLSPRVFAPTSEIVLGFTPILLLRRRPAAVLLSWATGTLVSPVRESGNSVVKSLLMLLGT